MRKRRKEGDGNEENDQQNELNLEEEEENGEDAVEQLGREEDESLSRLALQAGEPGCMTAVPALSSLCALCWIDLASYLHFPFVCFSLRCVCAVSASRHFLPSLSVSLSLSLSFPFFFFSLSLSLFPCLCPSLCPSLTVFVLVRHWLVSNYALASQTIALTPHAAVVACYWSRLAARFNQALGHGHNGHVTEVWPGRHMPSRTRLS